MPEDRGKLVAARRATWPRHYVIDGDHAQIKATLRIGKGDGVEPIVSAGFVCFNGAGQKTWRPLALDHDAVAHSAMKPYIAQARRGEGPDDLPLDTISVRVALQAENDNSHPEFSWHVEQTAGLVGAQVNDQLVLTDALGLRLQTLSFLDGNYSSQVMTIEQVIDNAALLLRSVNATLAGDPEADPPIPSVEARWISAINTEVGPTGGTGQELRRLSVVMEGDAAADPPTLGILAQADANLVTSVGPSGALVENFNALKAKVEDPMTGLGTRATSADISSAIAGAGFASASDVETLQAQVDGNPSADPPTPGIEALLAETSEVAADAIGHGRATWGLVTQVISGTQRAVVGIQALTEVIGQTVTATLSFYANQIIIAGGQAMFTLSGALARLNVPLEIIDGGNGAYVRTESGGRQTVTGAGFGLNGDLDYWKGPTGIAVNQMTLENSYFADGPGAGDVPYIGGSPYAPGTSNAAVNNRVFFSGATNTTAICDTFKTGGTAMAVAVRLRAQSSRLYKPLAGIVVGRNVSGSVQLKIEVNTNGQGWTPLHNGGDVRGELITSWVFNDSDEEGPEENPEESPDGTPPPRYDRPPGAVRLANEYFSLIVNYSGSLTRSPGDMVQWRARAINWGAGTAMPPGHSPSGELEIFVNENG